MDSSQGANLAPGQEIRVVSASVVAQLQAQGLQVGSNVLDFILKFLVFMWRFSFVSFTNTWVYIPSLSFLLL